MWKIFQSEHYIFNFHENSLAEKHIREIALFQENCFNHITRVLNISVNEKIKYFLCNDSKEVGKLYGDDDPCNGFCRYPEDEGESGLYAVYNDKTKCLGYHEDAHYITYLKFGVAKSTFLREGLAMCFDKTWWGIPNEIWVKNFITSSKYISLNMLLEDEIFYKHNQIFTYTLASAFTSFLIFNYGNKSYTNLYKKFTETNSLTHFESIYNKSIEELENEFKQDLINTNFAEFINKEVKLTVDTINI
ncbi:hypothetical protein [Clostridium ihumii]|uniref:hypothetical protein n=1 Tax=Clostridium ihumii TaxID=1470356 RepID=UPI003D327C19